MGEQHETANLDAWLAYCAAGGEPKRTLGWMIDCGETCETHADAKRFIEAYEKMLPWETVAKNMDYFIQEGISDEREGLFQAAFREVQWKHEQDPPQAHSPQDDTLKGIDP